MKNCDPFVSLPLLAIDSRYSLLCLTAKLSSGGERIRLYRHLEANVGLDNNRDL